jgi:hypothetical protein
MCNECLGFELWEARSGTYVIYPPLNATHDKRIPMKKAERDKTDPGDIAAFQKLISTKLPQHLQDMQKNETQAVNTMVNMIHTIDTLRKKLKTATQQLEAAQNAKVGNCRQYQIAPDELHECQQRIHERNVLAKLHAKPVQVAPVLKADPFVDDEDTSEDAADPSPQMEMEDTTPDEFLSAPGTE